MHRFFLPSSSIKGSSVTINGPLVHQIRDVLRLTAGSFVRVLDNSGWEYEVELALFQKNAVTGTIRRKNLTTAEPRTKVTIFQALLKGAKFELVLQKGTELGVVGFVPMASERCVPGDVSAVSEAKVSRWERIVLEAAEQSRRGKLPRLMRPISFQEACRTAEGLSLLLWEGEKVQGLKAVLRQSQIGDKTKEKETTRRPFSVNLFVGPEGGFSEGEAELARSRGIHTVSLGQRLLRAETAGIVASTALLYELGDLGG